MGTTILSFQHRVVIETLHNEGRSLRYVKGGFELSFYGGLKMYDLGGLGIDRCQTV